MTILDLFLIGTGLSMDALAVSICKGLTIRTGLLKKAFVIGLWFGGFQALMPAIGWALGSRFADAIKRVDHWIAFILLFLIGANMIREALSGKEEEQSDRLGDSIDPVTMFLLAVATSIDALAVGVTFSFLDVNVVFAALFIGCTTFTISFLATLAAKRLGAGLGERSGLVGGAVLIFIGVKILIEHLFFQ